MYKLYHSEWQNNRLKFILSKFSAEFFKGKTILELGAFNGYIGNFFHVLGANVVCIEGRQENVESIEYNYPYLKVIQADLDTDNWGFGQFDIIINFGLLYHLENYHKEHLKNCIQNSKILLLESVVYDSKEAELYYREEDGNDQSLTKRGGTPTTTYINDALYNSAEDRLTWTCYHHKELNGGMHIYDWEDKNSQIYSDINRRFWIIKKI